MSTEIIPLFAEDGFIICFTAEPEPDDMRTHFRNCGHTAAQIKRFEKYDWFCAKVSAWRDGVELGTAYLGGCCYKRAADFYTIHKGDYFADMVKEAIAEAKVRMEGRP